MFLFSKKERKCFDPWPSLIKRLIEVDILNLEPYSRSNILNNENKNFFKIMYCFKRERLKKEIKCGLLNIKKIGLINDLIKLINDYHFFIFDKLDKNNNILTYLNLKHNGIVILELEQVLTDPDLERFVI